MAFTDSADTSDQDIDKYLMSKKPAAETSPGLVSPQDKMPKPQQTPADIEKILSTMPKMPAMPKLQNIPPAPSQQYDSPYKAMSGPLMFFATLASLMTRHPAQTAMNSFSAMINANVKGQKQQMDEARENWKESMDVVLQQNQVELERYHLIQEKYKDDVNAQMAHIMAMASAFNDPVAQAAFRLGPEMGWKVLQDRQTQHDRLVAATQRQEEIDEHKRHDIAEEKSLGKSPQAMALQRYLEEHPNASAAEIQSFQQNSRSGRSGLAIYMNKYLAENPDATADDIKRASQQYTTQTTAQNRFFSGPQGNTVRSLNVVVSHLKTMSDLSAALNNGDYERFNKVAQQWAEETGHPAPTNFDTAKQIVGAEVIKALGVAGAGTQTERKEAADDFNRARSPQAISGAINTMRSLLVGQLKGLRRQFVSSTGLEGEQFDDMLEPETQDYLRIDIGSGKTEVKSRGNTNPDLGPTDKSGWSIEKVQ